MRDKSMLKNEHNSNVFETEFLIKVFDKNFWYINNPLQKKYAILNEKMLYFLESKEVEIKNIN